MAQGDDVASIHELWLLIPAIEKAPNMDIKRHYKRDRRLFGRVCPVSSRVETDMYQRGMTVSHKIYFSSYPGPVEEQTRLIYGHTVMTTVGPVVDVNNLGMLWIVYADAKSRHNRETEIIK